MSRSAWVRAGATLAVGAFALAACGSSDQALDAGASDSGTVVVTSETFAENVLLAELYAAALESVDVTVERNLSVGSRELYLKDMETGASSLVPEYTGNLLLQYDPAATATSSADVFAALPAALPDTLEVLEPSPAEDKDALAMTQETANRLGVTSIADLGPRCADLNIGAAPTLQTRQAGLVGIAEKYGCTFGTFTSLDSGGPLTLQALLDGTIDVADLYTTDPAIPDNDLVLLKDPENVFPAQNIVPLYHGGALNDAAKNKLNELSAALDTETLTQLLRRVTIDQEPAATVAGDWLTERGLI